MNIVSVILQYLGPSLVNKFATALGMESSAASKAVSVAIPAILSGIIGRATAAGGAKTLQDVIGRQEPGILDRLAESVGSSKQGAMAEAGRTALGTLVGVDQIGSLAGALSKFTGGSLGSANTLLSLVTPGILGVLGREQKSQGLDAAGLVNMLAGQKHNIASALPAEFKSHLEGSTLLDAISVGSTPSAADAAARSPSVGTTYTPPITARPAAGRADFSWPSWLLAIAAAGTMWFSVFGNRLAQLVDMNSVQPTNTASQAKSLTIGTVDVGRETMDTLDAIKAALTAAKVDPAGRASLMRLQDAAARLDKIDGLASQLRPDARRRLGEMVGGRSGEMRTVSDAALQTSGLSAPLKMLIEQVSTRIAVLARL